MYYIFVTLFVVIITILIWCNEQKKKFRSLKDIPGPIAYPIVGNVLEFGFNSYEQLKNIQRLSEIYKPFAKVWAGPKELYVISTDPDFHEFILSSPKHIKKSTDYDFLRPWLRNGLLLSSGSYWQNRRKILTPAFHFKILEGFINVFNAETNILIERLSKIVDKGVFDVYPYLTDCTLDIICETAMGTSVKAQRTVNNEYVNAVKVVCTVAVDRFFSIWKRFDILFPLSNDYRNQQKAIKYLHAFTKSVIQERRIKLNDKTPSETPADDVGLKKRQVFLDILLNATVDGLPLSDADIQEEVDTFMFEGHDTTASLIAFTMYELARNPDIQDNLFAELRAIFNDDKFCQPVLQDLKDMKYTERVLKETLRLYPSAPYIGRVLTEDVNYKGTIFPKDTRLGIILYSMQRRADLFPNPNKFDPDRFLPENSIGKSFAYTPFSAGPRNCIGQKFAMHEAKCLIAKLLMNFEMLPVDSKYEVMLSSEVVLKSANGVHVHLKNREF